MAERFVNFEKLKYGSRNVPPFKCKPMLSSPHSVPDLFMVSCDEPQFNVQVASSLLGPDEMQNVFMPHAREIVNVILILPRQLVLRKTQSTQLLQHTGMMGKPLNTDPLVSRHQ